MWMEKMRRGVLQVSTDSGIRYVQPSLSERLQLLWTFRNFNVLSEEVLSEHEKHVLDELCTDDRLFRPHDRPRTDLRHWNGGALTKRAGSEGSASRDCCCSALGVSFRFCEPFSSLRESRFIY